jgi:hypothetical protein
MGEGMSAQNEIRVERIGLATLYLADCMEVLPALYLELLRVWMWPVRVWLAWWGVR